MDICNEVMADLAHRNAKTTTTGGGTVDPDQVLAYIMRAIDHQVIDTFRTLARQCRDFRRNEPVRSADFHLASSASTPSRIAVRREIIDWVRSKLSGDDARLIDLMLANHDWNEIGTIMGIQPDTARMRVRRAIDRARQEICMNESTGDDP
jgi:DNA-directed RNA polymerase specialized sigma24 family protein